MVLRPFTNLDKDEGKTAPKFKGIRLTFTCFLPFIIVTSLSIGIVRKLHLSYSILFTNNLPTGKIHNFIIHFFL